MARCGCAAGGCSCVVRADNDDTTCIDVAVTGNGTLEFPFLISAEPIIDPAAGNLLSCELGGLRADLSTTDSGCVDFSGLGTPASPLTASLTFDPDTDDCLNCGPQGIQIVFNPDTDDCLNCSPSGITLIIDPDPSNILSCGPSGLFAIGGGGGGDAFITVAASDTPAAVADFADFVCDGTADQVEIEAALAVSNHVILLEGTFVISADVTIPTNSWLQGSGRQVTFVTTTAAIPYPVASTGSFVRVSNMTISSNNAAAGVISLTINESAFIYDCYLLQNSTSATISAVLLGGTGSQIVNSQIVASDLGLTITDGSDYVEVAGNLIEAETTILLAGADFCSIHDNRLRGVGAASGDGILLQGSADDNVITNNILTDYGDNGIRLINVGGATPDRNNIQGNTLRQLGGGDDYGINVLSGTDNLVTNNDLLNSGTLGPFNDAGTGTIVSAGNRV